MLPVVHVLWVCCLVFRKNELIRNMNDISVEKCTNGNNSSLDALLIDVLRNDVIVRQR